MQDVGSLKNTAIHFLDKYPLSPYHCLLYWKLHSHIDSMVLIQFNYVIHVFEVGGGGCWVCELHQYAQLSSPLPSKTDALVLIQSINHIALFKRIWFHHCILIRVFGRANSNTYSTNKDFKTCLDLKGRKKTLNRNWMNYYTNAEMHMDSINLSSLG